LLSQFPNTGSKFIDCKHNYTHVQKDCALCIIQAALGRIKNNVTKL